MAKYIDKYENPDELINFILGKSLNQTLVFQNQEEIEYLNPNPTELANDLEIDYFGNVRPSFEFLNEEGYSAPSVVCEEPLISGLNQEDSNHLSNQKQFIFPRNNLQTYQSQRPTPQKRQKNSNTIKKIGRIILDNLKEYRNHLKPNAPVSCMLKMLSKNSKIGRTQINKRDKFNTYHLRMLVNGKDDDLINFNLHTTRRILCKYLRNNVLNSSQITDQNKTLYLNTMKCSALRCINKNLAVRLQMSM